MNKEMIQNVPTNIITGFLGSGKTSAILHLLKNKPSNERWAVLVNEFGEIGIDGHFLADDHTEHKGVFIREVPGGCMCCAAGVPMQIALNQLLKHAKPDRLLIEPTGLGHPKEILQVLSAEHYQDALNLQKTLTLVDARQLKDTRYISHATFNQQIAIADVLIGNKADLYQAADKARLITYAKAQAPKNVVVTFSEHGNINGSQLAGNTALITPITHIHHHKTKKTLASDMPMPESGFIKAMNKGEGFNSIGWRFSDTFIFDDDKLMTLLTNVEMERIKGVFITQKGCFSFNGTTESLTVSACNKVQESRIEVIAQQLNNAFEKQLMACCVPV